MEAFCILAPNYFATMLSILIPTYNYNVMPLVQVLHRQAVQAGIAFEIIVLDDHSTETYITSTEQGNVFYLQNDINLGRTATRKKLAEKARYTTLLFLDADVIPVSEDFIAKYVPYLSSQSVVLGGIAYVKATPENNKELRYKYGRLREEKTAVERSINPYGSVLSGNLLIPKSIFLANNYAESNNMYGLDIYFSYRLYKSNAKIIHIDNAVYHIGLETNEMFFKKTLSAVVSRKQLLNNAKGIENINGLLKQYNRLKKYRLTGIVRFFFNLTEPLLKKMILKKDPNLFCLDIYRLGYICHIK